MSETGQGGNGEIAGAVSKFRGFKVSNFKVYKRLCSLEQEP
jgi:hypothetical protein